MINNTNYKFFTDCVLTKGISRSLVVDFGRNKYFLIPNSLYKILVTHSLLNFYELQSLRNSQKEKSCIEEYYNFLISNELIFECENDEVNLFPSLSLDWDYPFEISNAIIDIQNVDMQVLTKIFTELESINCLHIQIRCYTKISLAVLRTILMCIHPESIFNTIEIVLPYSKELINNAFIIELTTEFPMLIGITLYGCESNEVINLDLELGNLQIVLLKENIKSCLSCGNINSKLFNIGIKNFTESLNYNSCLNKKISIDSSGKIKNCPSMNNDFGNIKDTSLEQVINKPQFRKLWSITKDVVSTCKDCEFRHICTDCRAYVEDPQDILSKPLKCGYDPYTAKWSSWSTSQLKQKAINFYGLLSEIA